MIEIFAIVFCFTIHDPKYEMFNQCRVWDKFTFRTLEQCERQRQILEPQLAKSLAIPKSQGGFETRCYKKTVRPEWEPAE